MANEALPSLLSELTSCKCDGDRVRTRTHFEDQCKVLDAKLNHLVKLNSTGLSSLVKSTSNAIDFVGNSKAKCRSFKERLALCQDMLQCKRDDLKRLWLESLQHKRMHQMLEEIGKLRKIPKIVNESLLEKKYLEATQVLVSSIHVLEGELSETEALKDLRAELHRLVDKFYSIFLEELCQELYMSTFHLVFQGTNRNKFEDVTYEKVFKCQNLRNASKSINFNVSYITTLLECISLLRKIPETLEILKEECQSELMGIVHKLSKLMFDVVQRSTDTLLLELSPQQQQIFLVDLFETVIGHFRQISINHKIFLHILEKIVPPTVLEESCYGMVDLYSNIQDAIEQVVSSYLEIQPLSTPIRQNTVVFSNSEIGNDISHFFLPKAYSESKCRTLFKFKNSSQGLIRNRKKAKWELLQTGGESHVQDNTVDTHSQKLVLICKPSVKNITLMFKPVKSFVLEIGMALGLEAGMNCPLHMFLFDYVAHFLDQVNSEINKVLESASMNLESWGISCIPGDSGEPCCSEKPILSSTMILHDYLKELQRLIKFLPDFSSHFLQLVYYVILDYKDLVHKVFKSFFAEEQNILSVTWAKDTDIRRLLKSFSNWKHLEVAESGEMVESPEDIRLRNKEESELLIRNLNSEEQSSWEIISDYSVLLHLALLQESLLWFSTRLLNFVDDFRSIDIDTLSVDPESQIVSPCPETDLRKLAKEYEDFSDVCLMALHLEVRAHCFQHLLPFSAPERYVESDLHQEFEAAVKNLTDDLVEIERILGSALTTKELKYIFEGLGELVASILIHNVSNMRKVNALLVKRLQRNIFILQCCLGNITMTREVSLERAKIYIQLLNKSCEDILNDIVEEGPKFKEQEYVSLFRLIQEKNKSGTHPLNDYVAKLQKILKRYSSFS